MNLDSKAMCYAAVLPDINHLSMYLTGNFFDGRAGCSASGKSSLNNVNSYSTASEDGLSFLICESNKKFMYHLEALWPLL